MRLKANVEERNIHKTEEDNKIEELIDRESQRVKDGL